MKKNLLALAMALTMTLSFTACGNTESDTKVIEADNSTASSDSPASAGGYTFEYKGTNIAVDADAAPIISALGDPSEYFESPSCAADGIGKLYTYPDFQIQTYPDGDKDYVEYVLLRTDLVATSEGIDLSSSREDVMAAYGDATTETDSSLEYEKDGMTLLFLFDGDSISSIQYNSPKSK
ncbi:MAG: hypothetical protein K5773_00440 [Pseudobutyrivibrio sp.]|nr:hypothetical protein [Pseudobutyrivibrio sp.]